MSQFSQGSVRLWIDWILILGTSDLDIYSLQGSGGSRTVELKEGVVNEIKIEVTAEDGTTRIYVIQAKRLSAKDAVLSGLKVSAGSLHPEFNGDVFSYTCK